MFTAPQTQQKAEFSPGVWSAAHGRCNGSLLKLDIVRNNNLRWDSFHTLNVRGDYRRSLSDVDLVAFLDILSVYGNFGTGVQEFNPTTGGAALDDGELFPLIGIQLRRLGS